MAHWRFLVKYDGDIIKTTKRIIHALIVNRIKKHKPCVICIVGKSGEGKSNVGLFISDATYELEGIDFVDYVQPTVIMSATEFGAKTRDILRSPELKKAFIIMIDEAKATVNSQDWATAVNRTIAMVNSLSRAIKPMAIIIVAQSLKDIDRATRETIDYYIKVTRDDDGGHAKIYEFWVDDRDLDRPKTKKRIVSGMIENEKGNIQPYQLNKITFGKVRKDVWNKYNGIMYEAKDKLIEAEFENLDRYMQDKYSNKEIERVVKIAEYLQESPEQINEYGTYKYGKWKLNKEFKTHFNLSDLQVKELQVNLTKYLQGSKERNRFDGDVSLNEGQITEKIILGDTNEK